MTLKEKENIPVFVVYGSVGKYTTLVDQAIKDNVSANSVIRLSDYIQRKYHNLKDVADHSVASGITNVAL